MSCCSRRKYSKGAKAASQQKSRGSRSFMKTRLYCLCQRPGICRRCTGCSACFTLNNKRSNKPGRSFLPGSLSKNPRVDKGPQPLMFNPALTTCASERMKTQRFSYFADFAARERMREAKPVKLKKVAFSHFFDTLSGRSFLPGIAMICYKLQLLLP